MAGDNDNNQKNKQELIKLFLENIANADIKRNLENLLKEIENTDFDLRDLFLKKNKDSLFSEYDFFSLQNITEKSENELEDFKKSVAAFENDFLKGHIVYTKPRENPPSPRPLHYNPEKTNEILGNPIFPPVDPTPEKPLFLGFKRFFRGLFSSFDRQVTEYDKKVETFELRKKEQKRFDAIQKEKRNKIPYQDILDFDANKLNKKLTEELDNRFALLDNPIAEHGSKDPITINRSDHILIDGQPLSALLCEHFYETRVAQTSSEYEKYLRSKEYKNHSQFLLEKALRAGCDVSIYPPDINEKPWSLQTRNPKDKEYPLVQAQKEASVSQLEKLPFYKNQERIDALIKESNNPSTEPNLLSVNKLLNMDNVNPFPFSMVSSDKVIEEKPSVFDNTKDLTEEKLSEALDTCFAEFDAKYKQYLGVDGISNRANRFDYILIDGVPFSFVLSSLLENKKYLEKTHMRETLGEKSEEPDVNDLFENYQHSEEYKKEGLALLSNLCKKDHTIEIYAPTKDMELPKKPVSIISRKPDMKTDENIKKSTASSLFKLKRMAYFDKCEAYNSATQKKTFFTDWVENTNKAESTELRNKKLNPYDILVKDTSRLSQKDMTLRSIPTSVAIAYMVEEKGYCFEDVLDPKKYPNEKTEAGNKIMELMIKTNDKEKNQKNDEFLQELSYNFINRMKNYVNDKMKNVDVTDPDKVFSENTRLAEQCSRVCFDLEDILMQFGNNFDAYEKKKIEKAKKNNITINPSGLTTEKLSDYQTTMNVIQMMKKNGRTLTRFSIGNKNGTNEEQRNVQCSAISLSVGAMLSNVQEEEKTKLVSTEKAYAFIDRMSYVMKDTLKHPSKKIDTQKMATYFTRANLTHLWPNIKVAKDPLMNDVRFDETKLNKNIMASKKPSAVEPNKQNIKIQEASHESANAFIK